ncbi:MAG: hypothetical protein AAGF86_00600 [Pseudomonadota bacterium]
MKFSFTYGLFGPKIDGFLLPPIWQDDWDVFHGTFLDDEFDGGDGNDMMWGSLGADLFFGGAGSDTVNYSNQGTPSNGASYKGVTVDLEGGKGYGGLAEGDRYSSVENVIGTAFNDYVVGSSAKNKILTGDGIDQVVISDGADFLDGGAGRDQLFLVWHDDVTIDLMNGRGIGGIADGDTYLNFEKAHMYGHRNTFIGSDEDEELFVRGTEYDVETNGGDDLVSIDAVVDGQIDGGAGIDTLSFFGVPSQGPQSAPLVFDLANGEIRHMGASQGDPKVEISNIENIYGSSHDDVIIDGRGDNEYIGGWGADVFVFDHDFRGERDVVLGISQGDYTFDLSQTPVRNYEDLIDGGPRRMEQVGADTVIYTGRDNQIKIAGIQMDDLTSDYFIF